jgi:hypothetical protein
MTAKTTFTISTQYTVDFAEVPATSFLDAIQAAYDDIGQGDEPDADTFEETVSWDNKWVYRITSHATGQMEYFKNSNSAMEEESTNAA